MTGPYRSSWKDESVSAVLDTSLTFVETEIVAHLDTWEKQHHVDRDVWLKAGELGLLCCSIPEEYGGGGGTFAHEMAICEAQGAAGDTSWGNMVHSGIVAHYILAYGTEVQRRTWLPLMATGEVVAAIAMTEPGAGSDLKGVRTKALEDGDDLVVNGAKTFISNGHTADLILVVAKTDPAGGHSGISLVLVDVRDAPGFARGRILDKVGQHGADTSELSFSDVRVPRSNVLGGVPGKGFKQLMTQLAQERLLVAAVAVTAMESALRMTTDYTKERRAFGQSIFDFQNTQMVLAEAATVAHVSRVFLDSCVERHLAGDLDGTTAAMAKWWLTEQQGLVLDKCVQLHGGYGYMREYAIARMYQDARVQRIYGGSNEVMKQIVARSL
ncbi:alkylation response protein AidB-like acyl-CoA dehydrogenase [Nocardioides daedukensis]|uniref:Acyl-[acyl-carrier-protein] dehydrogenase MbtN n=1 Tax=Nocardioides daedukensis TaxID=634462 RepID=A0A7Y9URI0_9ACTN|nr:acyl-CoA dehydrogenase family protein [Nocardioides daedukensis]NYG59756.1 alkylation response protein AidB-like acyl-CoA dehydrogenase [Nocardioides daedukensis]